MSGALRVASTSSSFSPAVVAELDVDPANDAGVDGLGTVDYRGQRGLCAVEPPRKRTTLAEVDQCEISVVASRCEADDWGADGVCAAGRRGWWSAWDRFSAHRPDAPLMWIGRLWISDVSLPSPLSKTLVSARCRATSSRRSPGLTSNDGEAAEGGPATTVVFAGVSAGGGRCSGPIGVIGTVPGAGSALRGALLRQQRSPRCRPGAFTADVDRGVHRARRPLGGA